MTKQILHFTSYSDTYYRDWTENIQTSFVMESIRIVSQMMSVIIDHTVRLNIGDEE